MMDDIREKADDELMRNKGIVSEELLGMEKLEPTIQRKHDPNEDVIFKGALAKMHNVNPDEIKVVVEGPYKFYKINGVNIFRDRNTN